jgi:methionyl-tRNA formyltransferase
MNKILKPATFFGSGPVASESLKGLLDWANIETVVTKATPPHHKEPAPVEELAKKNGLNILYANNKAELNILLSDKKLPKHQYGIVIDYGVIISQDVINYYPKGIINSHFSLLPQWRGADPITFALLSGQSSTGVTLMLIDSGMDTGNVLATQTINISQNDNNFSLTSKLINLSNDCLKKYLNEYLDNKILPIPQSDNLATYSVKINKNDGLINISKPNSVIVREIKAYNPWPGSRINIKNHWLSITDATISNKNNKPGTLFTEDKKLYLACRHKSIQILELKPAGKNKMGATAFINGYAHLISN